MARRNNDNHKTGKQSDARKEKQGNKQINAAAGNTKSATTDNVKTHYHSPHAY